MYAIGFVVVAVVGYFGWKAYQASQLKNLPQTATGLVENIVKAL